MTPIYDATLSDLLLQARRRVEAAELGRRQERVRHAVALQAIEARLRAEVVDTDEPVRPAPPVPSMSELMAPTRSNDAFFDALLGPARS